MLYKISSQVDGLKTVYAYDPGSSVTEDPSAYFEFESMEKADAASKVVKELDYGLNVEIDRRIPWETKFEVILGYTDKENEVFRPCKRAQQLVEQVLVAMGTLKEIKEVPVMKIEYRQLKFLYDERLNQSNVMFRRFNDVI